MKMIPSLVVAAVSLAALLSVPTARAAKLNFSDLAGQYKASYLLHTSGALISGNVTINVTVPENGRQAKMQIAGYGSYPSFGTVVLVGNLKFTSRHTVIADNALLALYAQLPSSAHFSGSGSTFRFTLATSTLGGANMTYVLKHNGKSLSIVGNGEQGGSPASVVISGKKRGSR